ncbi:leucine-rich repeat domain-containing protein [Jejuia spongiicola]|uniref:Leucine-rich repeat domain-containing protein n=1 Tax=Jejuia spongiicola TaxID=2942207 RepID=A0ABT0QCT6_9FLAO|nr:hypothetical protein [Jejuia spongiicola]MCL6294064.1 hypothetical protein [Jejuia spongiicola]
MTWSKAIKLICVIPSCLIISCSDDNTNTPSDDLYLNIPDANFEAKLISLGIDSDNTVNKQMLKTDAKNIQDLNVDNLDINDLTGIEGFVDLKKLSAAQNSITQIDLKYNKLLDTLILFANNIKSIDLSNNPELLKVNIESNELTTLMGMSNTTKLKRLDASFNYLKEFSINHEAIEVLYISDNDLESFDVEGAVNLKNIFLKTNKLTSIDVSSNTLLETLVLSDNKIKELNLEQNSALTVLWISSNLLTGLDVSNLNALSFLSVYNNPDLSCIKIYSGQDVPNLTISDSQELNVLCD